MQEKFALSLKMLLHLHCGGGLPYYKKFKRVFGKPIYALVSYSLVQTILLLHGLQYIVYEYIWMELFAVSTFSISNAVIIIYTLYFVYMGDDGLINYSIFASLSVYVNSTFVHVLGNRFFC